MAFDPKDIKKDPDVRESRPNIEPWARDIETPKGGFVRLSAVEDGPAQDNRDPDGQSPDDENAVAAVDERVREERADDANHARRGETNYGGRRRGAAAAARDAQKNPGESSKKDKGKDDFDLQLMILNQQIAMLDREIGMLNREIDDILKKHLSPEEYAYINGIDDEEERHREEMRLMREKLEKGEITQAEFEAFKMRWDERAQKMQERQNLKERVKSIENKQDAEKILETENTATTEVVAEQVGGEQGRILDVASGSDDIQGNTVEEDSAADEKFVSGTKNVFGGSVLSDASRNTSVASQMSAPGLKGSNPPIKDHFEAVRGQTEAQPEKTLQAQAEMGQDKEAPTPGQLPQNTMMG